MNLDYILPFPCFVYWIESTHLQQLVITETLDNLWRTSGQQSFSQTELLRLIRIQVGRSDFSQSQLLRLIKVDQDPSWSIREVSSVSSAGWPAAHSWALLLPDQVLLLLLLLLAHTAAAAVAVSIKPLLGLLLSRPVGRRYGDMGSQRENRKQLSCAGPAAATARDSQGLAPPPPPPPCWPPLLSSDPRSQRDISQHCRGSRPTTKQQPPITHKTQYITTPVYKGYNPRDTDVKILFSLKGFDFGFQNQYATASGLLKICFNFKITGNQRFLELCTLGIIASVENRGK